MGVALFWPLAAPSTQKFLPKIIQIHLLINFVSNHIPITHHPLLINPALSTKIKHAIQNFLKSLKLFQKHT